MSDAPIMPSSDLKTGIAVNDNRLSGGASLAVKPLIGQGRANVRIISCFRKPIDGQANDGFFEHWPTPFEGSDTPTHLDWIP